jgi:hypothetical protein
MTITNSTKLSGGLAYAIAPAEAAAAETAEGTFGTNNLAESLALTEGFTELADFTYSATAEGRTGEVADANSAIDVDAEPGLIFTGPSGSSFQMGFRNIDVSEGTIAPEATDSVTAALLVNNEIVAFADEGYVSEIDTGIATEFNLENGTYVTLQESDVVRLCLVGGGEEVADWDVDTAGSVWING